MILSIIIPIYNVEKYIEGTLSSIYDQKVEETDFEVICVNDGTPDNSMSIVERFADIHPNLTIINQSNQGFSCARYAGMRIAVGEYLWFVDSDDKIADDSIKELINDINSNNVDIIGYNIQRIDEGTHITETEYIVHSTGVVEYNNIITDKSSLRHVHIAPSQRFLFRRSFLLNNNLTFYPSIYYEDVEFNIRALSLTNRIILKNYAPYLYLVRQTGSIMSSLRLKHTKDNFKIYENFMEMSYSQLSPDVKCFLRDKAFVQLVDVYRPMLMEKSSPDIKDYLINKKCNLQKNSLKIALLLALNRKYIKTVIRCLVFSINPNLYIRKF